MNRNILIGIVVVVVAGAGAYFILFNQQPSIPPPVPPSIQPSLPFSPIQLPPFPEPPPASEVKEFTMIARKFVFEPATITVNKGDTVRLRVKSIDVTHGIAIPDFGVNAVLLAGETKTIEFLASKAGTYPLFCSIFCGSGHSDMKGTLVVQE